MPNLPIKITQISKDFNIKSKDVLDTFKDIGIDKKSGGSADADEFELFISHLMNKHQIKDLDAYRDGRVKITSDDKKESAKKEETAPKAETVVTDEEVTNSYTYVVAVEDGKKVIKLTDDVTKEVLTYSFETGSMERYSHSCSNENCAIHDPSPEGDDNSCPCGVGKLTPVTLKFEFLVINGQNYYDQNYRDWINN